VNVSVAPSGLERRLYPSGSAPTVPVTRTLSPRPGEPADGAASRLRHWFQRVGPEGRDTASTSRPRLPRRCRPKRTPAPPEAGRPLGRISSGAKARLVQSDPSGVPLTLIDTSTEIPPPLHDFGSEPDHAEARDATRLGSAARAGSGGPGRRSPAWPVVMGGRTSIFAGPGLRRPERGKCSTWCSSSS
jgi:hypothetical protein